MANEGTKNGASKTRRLNRTSKSELGWRIHENAKGWVAQVDIKAAASLAIEAAVLGFVISLVTNTDSFSRLATWAQWVFGAGTAALLVSVVLSILVLLPRIKLRAQGDSGQLSYLFFGHLRKWEPKKLTDALSSDVVDPDQLSGQIIKMSEIAWSKHLLLQWSLYFLLAGIVIVGAIYLMLAVGVFPSAVQEAVATVIGALCR